MTILAITDNFFTEDLVELALAPARAKGIPCDVRSWEQTSEDELQKLNLLVEQGGPGTLELPSALADRLEDVEYVVAQFCPFSSEFFTSAPKLKALFINRSGLENVDREAAEQAGVRVVNTPGRNASAVAEFTVAAILAELRNVARTHHAIKSGDWREDGVYPPQLHGSTVGIVGYGSIGQLLQQFLSGFECEILVHDPFVSEVAEGGKLVQLDELLQNSDVVTLHARLTPETEGLIGARELGLMREQAILVNTARSGLIDEGALVHALREGQIAGAALDVFEDEPLPSDSPFLNLPNVTLTPHLAGTSLKAFTDGPRMLARNLSDWLV